MNSLNG